MEKYMLVGTYTARGLGPSRASHRKLYHNHLMEKYKRCNFHLCTRTRIQTSHGDLLKALHENGENTFIRD